MNDVIELTKGNTQILLLCWKVNSLLHAEFRKQIPL
jgi:hypothetical protein